MDFFTKELVKIAQPQDETFCRVSVLWSQGSLWPLAQNGKEVGYEADSAL